MSPATWLSRPVDGLKLHGETIKEGNTIDVELVRMMEEVGVRLRFEWKSIRLGNEVIK